MSITAKEAMAQREADIDERSLHQKMQWFCEKWTTKMDLNKRDAAEFTADIAILIQAVHRDASRETHALLTKALMATPPQPIFIPKSGI